jgi:ribosome-binding ATPase
METGIIGLPLSGKTTLFNALTGLEARTSTHGAATKAVNLGDVPVPDERVDILSKMFKPQRTVYATVRFKDLQAEFDDDGGMSAATIAELRTSDAITLVVRAFLTESVSHPLEQVNPERDFHKLVDSLVFSDYAVAERRLERLAKEGKKGDREHQRLDKVRERLEEGKLIGSDFLSDEDKRLLSGFSFLTAKPIIVVANTGEASAETVALEAATKERGIAFFVLRADMEAEISRLPPEDQPAFLAELGVTEPARARFLATIYAALDLTSFLTVGEDEVRAWSIPRGMPAVRAAGRIHSDLEKGFIRAEVVFWKELVDAGGLKEAKTTGKLRLEGKEYPVKDGDVLNIRFNV